MHKLFSFKNIAFTFLLVVVTLGAAFFSVQAQTTGQQWGGGNNLPSFNTPCSPDQYNVHGQLFSSTIGWIYLNCADYSGNVGSFGVNQDSLGFWNGYGWSSTVGWVKFGGVGCPSNSGWNINPAATAQNCEVQRLGLSGSPIQSYPIVGWARACTGAANPTACSGGINPNSGDWDGWISMNGLNDQNPTLAGLQTTSNYRTQLSQLTNQSGQQILSGFVWGGSVVGWAKFTNAYVDPQNTPDLAQINLTASPATVTGNATTALTYSINPIQKDFFVGGQCTTTSSPSAGAPWNGQKANFSAASTVFSNTVTNVSVPAASVTYTITCPVSVPGGNQTVATASVTVTKTGPTVNLTVGSHDLCVAGSLGGPQTTTASWVASPGASYCKVFRNGTMILDQQNTIGSTTVGTFTTPTSTNYVTPTTPGSQHEYVVKCYDNTNALFSESNKEFVGIAPATWNGPTANGSLNCTQANWGITLGATSQNTNACTQSGGASSLSWSAWGVVPSEYTYAILKKNVNSQGVGNVYGPGVTYGLNDIATITTAGYYKVFYATAGGVISPVSSAQIYSPGTISGTNCFSGLSSGGPYCPVGSVNTAAILPKTYSWTSNAASCNLGGPNGSIQISTVPDTKTLTCSWSNGSTATSTASYGPLLDIDSAFCSTPPSAGTRPVIIEN